MKSKDLQQWTIRLKVSSEERKKIHKDAIDRGLSIAEHIKTKVLDNSAITKALIQGKSA